MNSSVPCGTICGEVGPVFLHMRDNPRPSVARVCQQFLEDEGIDAMDRPTHSKDLNPIKHIWDIVSHSVHPHHILPKTVQEPANALAQVQMRSLGRPRAPIRSKSRLCSEVLKGLEAHFDLF